MYNVQGKSNKDDLITRHAPMVKKLAYLMKAKLPPSIEVDDLIQAGMMGLLDAIGRYEEVHGAQFETYAMQRIRGSMLDELRSNDWVSRGLRQNMRKVETAISKLQQRLGRSPNESEVAAQLNMPLAAYQDILTGGAGHQLMYYEDFRANEDGESFLDRYDHELVDDPLQDLMDTGFRTAIIDAIEELPDREKLLMGLYYEQEMNLKEIGAILGVSESRVSQLHSQAVARLRASLRESAWIGGA